MTSIIKKITDNGKKKILILLITLVTFVILDGFLTQYLVPTGAAKEANSFLAPMIGKSSFIIVKIVGALLCAFILWDVHRRHQKLATIAAWVAVVGYGLIVVWNTALIIVI
jgi:hypothetical protein